MRPTTTITSWPSIPRLTLTRPSSLACGRSLLVFHVVLIGGIIAIGPKPIGEFVRGAQSLGRGQGDAAAQAAMRFQGQGLTRPSPASLTVHTARSEPGVARLWRLRFGRPDDRCELVLQAVCRPSLNLTRSLRSIASPALATTPPFFGFASALTFCGFTYGLFPGVLIAFTATLAGSSFAFFTYRYLLKDQFRGVMGNKSGRGREGGKYEAFQAVVRSKSLGLLIALRWCPLPFAISNAWYAVSSRDAHVGGLPGQEVLTCYISVLLR